MAPILHDRTNSDSPILQPNKRIRRVQSSRLSRFNLDSDDTFPSEHSSIYDAPLALSDENENHEGDIMSPLDLQKSLASLPLSPSLENLDQLADLPSSHKIQVQETVSTSHSNWPATQLETIAEQRSINTLHTSASLPHLNSRGTQRFSIDAELDNNASTPQRPSYWPPNWSAMNTPFDRRSFSENDASCLRFPTWKGKRSIYKEYESDSSASSGELLRRRCLAICPTYPLKPTYPPLERSPTPPGLPTFGSREAVELFRLPGIRGASARNTQGRPSIRNRLPAAVEEDPLPPSTPVLRPIDHSASAKGKSVIRRIIRNLSRSSSGELREGEARRVSLPAGFVARADDGTYVRGRWGPRYSGHGVGARTGQQSGGLEGHPFHRLESAGRTLEEEIREIDKACEASEGTQSQGVQDNTRAGVSRGLQSSKLQCSMMIPERGEPSTICSSSWSRFWPGRVNDPAMLTPHEAAVPLAGRTVNDLAILTPNEAAVPLSSRVRIDSQPEPVTAERACDGSRMLQRRISAESRIMAARLEDEEKRKQRQRSWETRCCDWMCGRYFVENEEKKEVSRIISRETGGDGPRRSPHVLESEEPGPPNARMVYPTLVSEEEVSSIISRESEVNRPRRGPHELESSDTGQPNARMVYSTLGSEEEVAN